jgi:hypothetical protein
MFIMRPDPALLASRAVGRTVATFAGAIAARLIVRRGPTELALAFVAVAAVSAMVAVRERLVETALGAALALTLGVVLFSGLRRLADRRASTEPTIQTGT